MHLGMANNVAGKFSFSLHRKAFSIFRVPKTGCFVKQPPNGSFKMVPPNFSKILGPLTWKISQPGYLKPFCPVFVKKANSCRIGRKSVRFELQVHDPMLMIFWKKNLVSKYAILSKIHCKFSEARPRAKNLHARHFDNNWNGHKKFKNGRNNVKPSRGVILCDIVASKNIKLEKLQISQKILLIMSYHVRGFMAFRPNDQCYG